MVLNQKINGKKEVHIAYLKKKQYICRLKLRINT